MFQLPSSPLKAAPCKSLPEEKKEIFFNGKASREAKKVCRFCTVREECLATARKFEEQPDAGRRFGIWGGMTARERDAEFGDPEEMFGDAIVDEANEGIAPLQAA